ncbi:MAG: N-acetyltransferase [Rhizobiaceae bacterium]
MSSSSISVRLEKADDFTTIETLTATVFGPAMLTRAAYALREGVPHESSLSFVAEQAGEIIGSVRLTKIMWGNTPALMLGPLGVLRKYKSQGTGKALMVAAVEAAKNESQSGGPAVIVLVGDYDYYAPFGFKSIPNGQISMPRPADPNRMLVYELVEGSLLKFYGPANRFVG